MRNPIHRSFTGLFIGSPLRRYLVVLYRLALLCVAVLFIPVSFKRFTQGFKLAKTQLSIPYNSKWERESILSAEEMDCLLKQPFSYLGKGSQSYVFKSADGQYVIKLFRFDQHGFPSFNRTKKSGISFERKIHRFSTASLLAFDYAREETGLVYLHLNLTQMKLPFLHATGPLGQKLRLPLDRFHFAIQKKVAPFRASLLYASQCENKEEMKDRIDSFVKLLEQRTEKGIGNSDPNLGRNFGFLGKRAIELDFGNYILLSGSRIGEIKRYTNRLRSWLSKNAPEWVSYLDERVSVCEDSLSLSQ